MRQTWACTRRWSRCPAGTLHLLSAKHMEGMGRYLLSLYHFRKQLSYFLN